MPRAVQSTANVIQAAQRTIRVKSRYTYAVRRADSTAAV